MTRIALRTALAAAFLLAAPAAAQRASLRLTVVEAETGLPVAGARVSVSGVGQAALTGPDGRAELRGIPQGRRFLSVVRIGFATERAAVEFGRSVVDADVELRPKAVELAALEVESGGRAPALRNAGFYERRRQGHGAFMDREQIARRSAIQMIDVFRQVRGFELAYTPNGKPVLRTTRGTCRGTPQLYLDGVLMYDFERRGDPSDFVHPDQVEAIEAYSGMGTIPPQYNSTGSACGVVLIWTRASS